MLFISYLARSTRDQELNICHNTGPMLPFYLCTLEALDLLSNGCVCVCPIVLCVCMSGCLCVLLGHCNPRKRPDI